MLTNPEAGKPMPGQSHDNWSSRMRERLADYRALRDDRRARRRARIGGDAGSAASQAHSDNFQHGGYFTTKTHDERQPGPR
jgi:hypothetical protein